MKVFSTEQFNKKAKALSAKTKASLSYLIARFEKSNRDTICAMQDTSKVSPSMFTAKIDDLRIFFTIEASDPEYLLLLDVADYEPLKNTRSFFAVKDPRSNNSLNPKFNTAINPAYNTSINPKYNTSLNPSYNTHLNPKYNVSINPKYNTTINPKYNTTINPRFNTTINPKYNTSINPKYNSVYGGPFLYSIDLNQEGYLVKANDQLSILFDKKGEQKGFTLDVQDNFTNLYSTEGNWIGYFIKANEDVSLKFDVNGQWLGLIV